MANTQYLTPASLENLKKERIQLKEKTILEIATRIDEAKQQGDLSENAEYHQAKEDMAWAQGRLLELDQIISNAKIIDEKRGGETVEVGGAIKIKINGKEKDYTIVGAQEANPSQGLISNESPLGMAFLGHAKNDEVEVITPGGKQIYKILEVK